MQRLWPVLHFLLWAFAVPFLTRHFCYDVANASASWLNVATALSPPAAQALLAPGSNFAVDAWTYMAVTPSLATQRPVWDVLLEHPLLAIPVLFAALGYWANCFEHARDTVVNLALTSITTELTAVLPAAINAFIDVLSPYLRLGLFYIVGLPLVLVACYVLVSRNCCKPVKKTTFSVPAGIRVPSSSKPALKSIIKSPKSPNVEQDPVEPSSQRPSRPAVSPVAATQERSVSRARDTALASGVRRRASSVGRQQ